MSAPAIDFADGTYVRDLEGLYVRWTADEPPAPELLVLNEELAADLGLDPDVLRTPQGIAALTGQALPAGVTSVAQGYAGHQFGGFSPRLGDGRAVLLGEVRDARGQRRDIHLKGSGHTPFARGGDGKAVVGPMLREHVTSEAMHALGIPTTRILAVVATGEQVRRETVLPGALVVRVASSHLRVGTFQYVTATLKDRDLLARLTAHAIARHHPAAAEADVPALALLDAVVRAQASLLAQWMQVGFIHGVMNTDNTTISGETIDYGPCAFLDAFDPATVFSSIDHGGRYAYGNQPQIAQWNLARLAEALLPLIAPDDPQAAVDAATAVLNGYPEVFNDRWLAGMRAKLGIAGAPDDGPALVDELLGLLHAQEVDWTGAFRALGAAARGDDGPLDALVEEPAAFAGWLTRWRALSPDAVAMDRVNPVYVPRNHLTEDALTMATVGDLEPYRRLVDAVTRPFDERPGLEAYARAAGPDAGMHVTYCGT